MCYFFANSKNVSPAHVTKSSRRSHVRRFGVKKPHRKSGNHRGSEETKLTKDVSINSEKQIVVVLLVAVVR